MEFTQGVRFDSLGLLPEMTRALEKKNIEWSTPVQAGCIPPMREWKDVIAKAPTGTGKTFAFGIPIIEHIDPESEEVQAVIMAPTRELAMQITAELRDLAVFMSGIRVVCLYGGAPIGKQIDALKKKPQIVVATPGRLSDHMKRRTVRLDRVQTVVLDEAARMLDMGFIHDVTRILDKIPSRRNLGMFSATISREVMDISWVYQRDPEEITVRADEQNKPDILQYAVTVEQTDKVLMTKQELENKIATLTGGRAAEEVVFSEITTGASNDIEQATKLARAMITRYGMSEAFDMVALETVSNQYLGGDTSLACSAQTQNEIDARVVALVKAEHEKARKLLEENRTLLDKLSAFLYEKETITGDEFMQIVNEKKEAKA